MHLKAKGIELISRTLKAVKWITVLLKDGATEGTGKSVLLLHSLFHMLPPQINRNIRPCLANTLTLQKAVVEE